MIFCLGRSTMLTLISICLFLASLIDGISSKAPYEGLDKFSKNYDFPDLEYNYDDLEPFIDQRTLMLHHKGHHMGYRNKLNAKLFEWRRESSDELASQSIVDIITNIDDVPENHRKGVQDFGGGFLNHALYFAVMSKNEGEDPRQPSGVLMDEIKNAFGSFQKFKAEFTAEALSLFGSGYVWLNQDLSDSGLNLVITTTANQDSPLSEGLQPILTLDVWEHAYYLKHQLHRPKHVEDWWRVVDWDQVKKLSDWWQQESQHDEL